MVDTPEKIWIEQDDCPYFYEESELTEVGSPVTEYTRSDLVAELKAENERLKHALEAANKRAAEAEARRKCYECGSEMTACAQCNPELPTAELTALRARVAELERALKTISRHPIENVCNGRPDLGIPGYASCQDVARAALKGAPNEQG